MFNLKYNIIVAIQVILNFINAILLIKIFGVSPETDAYFMVMTIFLSIYLIQLMPIEQFMYFYNDAKMVNSSHAKKFYNFGLMLSFIIGLVFFLTFILAKAYILKFFAYKLDVDRLSLLISYSSYYAYVLLFMPANYIFSSLLIAEAKIGYSYISTIVPAFFTFFSLVFSWVFNCKILFILQATALGYFSSFLIYLYVIKKFFNYNFKFSFNHEYCSDFIKNSMMMRLGHNINNFGLPFFTNNFLSIFQSGYVSQFYYAQRIAMALQNVVVGPSSKALQSKISYYISSENYRHIFYDVKKYIKLFFPVIISLGLLVYFLLPYGLNLISSSNLKPEDISSIRYMFLLFILWIFILLIESPFDMVLISCKKSVVFVIANSIFIVNYLLVFLFINKKFGIYSIFYSLIFTQMISLILYFSIANNKIKSLKLINYV